MLNLVCLLEEPSAENMLKAMLPKVLPDNVRVKYIVFEGKQDLEKQAQKRIQHYNVPNSLFLVMRDQDAGDCIAIKRILKEKADAAGKGDKTLIRIACHELESFFLGDLKAVEQGLKLSNLARLQNNRKYRTPDQLTNAAEELMKITNKSYRKLAGSRNISPYLRLDGSNRSKSFNVLIEGLKFLSIILVEASINETKI